MKVLLIKDVYKLGHAGDIKKVADGYGRNYLIPQRLAVLATPGALTQADRIRQDASQMRTTLNQELAGDAERLSGVTLSFAAKAGEGGKLYGSITPKMITDALLEETGIELSSKQIDSQPIRTIGIHKVFARLTVDLVPEMRVIVFREGETAAMVLEAAEALEMDEEEFEELEEEIELADVELQAEETGQDEPLMHLEDETEPGDADSDEAAIEDLEETLEASEE